MSCPACEKSNVPVAYDQDDPLQQRPRFQCPNCGLFYVSDVALRVLMGGQFAESNQRYKIAAFLREQKLAGVGPIRLYHERSTDPAANQPPGITIDEVLERFPKTFADLIDRILLNLSRWGDFYGATFKLLANLDQSVLFAKHKDEFEGLARYLYNLGYAGVKFLGDGMIELTLTEKGWARVEELQATRLASESKQAFVAMWFDSQLEAAYQDGIAMGISDAGYTPVRVDYIEHSGKICDRIIGEIRKSRFLVADLTGRRTGVFFEAGFAMGLGRPVVWLCRDTDFDQVKEDFDTRQYNYIVWSSSDDLRKRLRQRIEAENL